MWVPFWFWPCEFDVDALIELFLCWASGFEIRDDSVQLQWYLEVLVWEKDRMRVVIDCRVEDARAFIDVDSVEPTLERIQEVILKFVPEIQRLVYDQNVSFRRDGVIICNSSRDDRDTVGCAEAVEKGRNIDGSIVGVQHC
jgi:hypothetical protein